MRGSVTRRGRRALRRLKLYAAMQFARLVLRGVPIDRDRFYGVQRWSLERFGRLSPFWRQDSLNHKIQMSLVFNVDPVIGTLVDKLRVRDHVAAVVGEQVLVPLLQVADSWEALDLDRLPPSFVIKTNHDSGSVEIVRDRDRWDEPASRASFEERLRRTYGGRKGEWQYRDVPPRILVEELIPVPGGGQPVDYKFHCTFGRAAFVQIIERTPQGTFEVLTDPDGRVLPWRLNPERGGYVGALPDNLVKMREIAERLADDWSYVRVDLYSVAGTVRFGELTFSPGAGAYKGHGQVELGRLLDRARPVRGGLRLVPEVRSVSGRPANTSH